MYHRFIYGVPPVVSCDSLLNASVWRVCVRFVACKQILCGVWFAVVPLGGWDGLGPFMGRVVLVWVFFVEPPEMLCPPVIFKPSNTCISVDCFPSFTKVPQPDIVFFLLPCFLLLFFSPARSPARSFILFFPFFLVFDTHQSSIIYPIPVLSDQSDVFLCNEETFWVWIKVWVLGFSFHSVTAVFLSSLRASCCVDVSSRYPLYDLYDYYQCRHQNLCDFLFFRRDTGKIRAPFGFCFFVPTFVSKHKTTTQGSLFLVSRFCSCTWQDQHSTCFREQCTPRVVIG